MNIPFYIIYISNIYTLKNLNENIYIVTHIKYEQYKTPWPNEPQVQEMTRQSFINIIEEIHKNTDD